ncbi:MAG: lipase family protein, partial [Acidimicrobiales bacterium]
MEKTSGSFMREPVAEKRPDRKPIVSVAVSIAVSIAIALGLSAIATSVPTVALSATAATTSGCGSNSFYSPPSPLPSGAHGHVIRSRRGCDYLDPAKQAAAPAKVWNILYKSTNARGQQIAVSGTILVPTTAWSGKGPRPIVAYATGTQGWGDQCAPSREMAGGSYDENFAVQYLLQQGWAVAVTDYPGLGTPGNELYAVNKAEGYAVLDVLLAAKALRADALSSKAPTAIEGYSQGGGAAAFAAEEAPSYAAGMHLKG